MVAGSFKNTVQATMAHVLPDTMTASSARVRRQHQVSAMRQVEGADIATDLTSRQLKPPPSIQGFPKACAADDTADLLDDFDLTLENARLPIFSCSPFSPILAQRNSAGLSVQACKRARSSRCPASKPCG